jgi:hypothetical protein
MRTTPSTKKEKYTIHRTQRTAENQNGIKSNESKRIIEAKIRSSISLS